MEFNTVTSIETDEFICFNHKPRIDYLLLPSRFKTRIVDIASKELKPHLYKRWYANSSADQKNPLYHNSERQPLELDYQNKSKLYEKIFPSYLAVTEFKDTGNLVFNMHIKTLAYSLKTKSVFTKSKINYSFYIDKEANKPTLFKDGKLGYTDLVLNNFFKDIFILLASNCNSEVDFFKDRFLNSFVKGFGKYSPEDKTPREYLEQLTGSRGTSGLKNLYRVRNNPKLYDLPWDEYHLSGLYVSSHLALARRRILYHLKKGDTKAATAQGFYNIEFPKSIRKLMIQKFGPFEKSEGCFMEIKKLIEDVGLDNARNLLIAVEFGSLYRIQGCLEIGFTPRTLINGIKRDGYYYLNDVASMHYRCSRRENLTFNPNIREYHDYLLEVTRRLYPPNYTNFSEDPAYSELYKTVDTSKDLPYFETDKYIFRSPTTVSELAEVGNYMHICIGYYQDRAFLKNLNILLVIDKEFNTYQGCIEVRGESITQAKLKYNRPLTDNTDMIEDLKLYCTENNLEIHTRDIDRLEAHTYISEVESDISRLQLKRDFKLEEISGIEVAKKENCYDLFA